MSVILDQPMQAAFSRYDDRPHTDDAYAVVGKPIDEDRRVPMGDPKASRDASWYTMAISTRSGISLRISATGEWTGDAVYRGMLIRATAWSEENLKVEMLQIAAAIDHEVGGIRLSLR